MKNMIRSISLVAVLLVALTTISAANANSTATVQNNGVQNLGTVAVYASGSPYYVNVPGPGSFPVNVPSTPTSVVVNNYVIQQGQYGIATLPSGGTVKVTVSGNNIVVQDQNIVY
jgi:uncharacterized membrane protein YciS (DUF1049 family)